MKKIIVNDCAQYFTALKEIKKGIKAQILDYDEDEEIDGGFAAEEIIFPLPLGTLENIRKKYMLAVTEEIEKNCEESAYLIQFGKARIA